MGGRTRTHVIDRTQGAWHRWATASALALAATGCVGTPSLAPDEAPHLDASNLDALPPSPDVVTAEAALDGAWYWPGSDDGASDVAAPRDAATPDDGGAEADAGPLPTLPGVVLWLDATRGVTQRAGRVSAWADQSGGHHDAVQATAASQPTLVTVGGLTAVHFSGKSPASPTNQGGTGGPFLHVHDAPDLNWGTDDFLIAVVAAYSNPIDASHLGVIGAFYGKWGTTAGSGQILFTGNWPHAEHPNVEYPSVFFGFGEGQTSVLSPPPPAPPYNDSVVRLYVGRRAANQLTLRVNGTVVATRTGSNTNADSVGADVGIGSFSGVSSQRALLGDVYAVVAVHGVTSATDLASLESYLAARYHVPH